MSIDTRQRPSDPATNRRARRERVEEDPSHAPLPRATARWKLLVTAVLVVAAVWPVVGSRWLFPNLPLGTDDGFYLSQAQVLETGHLSAPAPENATSYRPWYSTPRGDRYVFRFPPTLPAVLATSDVLFGSFRPSLGFLSAWAILSVYLVLAALLHRRGPALFGAFLVLASPLYFLTACMYLSFVLVVATICTAGWLTVRGLQRDRLVNTMLAGVLFALAIFTRPYDGLLLTLPWVLWVALRLRHDRALLARHLRGLAIGATPIALLAMGYDHRLTGNAFRLPYQLWERRDTIGYGERSWFPGVPGVNFTFGKGVVGVARQWRGLADFTVPGLVVAAVLGLFVREARRLAPLILMFVTLSVGWLYFYGSYYQLYLHTQGPLYFLSLVVPLAGLAAVAAAWAFDRLATRGVRTLPIVAGAVVLVVAGSALHSHVEPWFPLREKTRQPLEAVAPTGNHRAVILVGEPMVGVIAQLRNDPGLDGQRLYAAELDNGADLSVVREHPDRKAFRLRGSPLRLSRVDVVGGPAIGLQVTVDPKPRETPISLDVTAGIQAERLRLSPATRHTTVPVAVTPNGPVVPGADAGLSPPTVGADLLIVQARFYDSRRDSETAWQIVYPMDMRKHRVAVLAPGVTFTQVRYPHGSWIAVTRPRASLKSSHARAIQGDPTTQLAPSAR